MRKTEYIDLLRKEAKDLEVIKFLDELFIRMFFDSLFDSFLGLFY